MGPHHADFVTIKQGATMSNAKCHPATAEDRTVLKNIVLEKNTFVGLMSMIQGGVTLEEGSAVATTTRCTKSLKKGQKQIGNKIMEAPKETKKKDADEEPDLMSSLTAFDLLKDLTVALVLRLFVNVGFILGMSAAVAVCFYANDYLPLPIVIAVAVAAVSFFVGVIYAKIIERVLHPRVVADLTLGQDFGANTWIQYLQGLYLSQAYTFSVINGSWIAAGFHRLLGADTPLDAQWYSTAIRDQCLLKVGSNSVIDQGAYMVGHVGQPGGTLSFKKASLGDNCTLHPQAIILSGQHMKDNSTLDLYSHSHIEKVIPENKHYTGNPAMHSTNSRVDIVASAF
jgi:acetyltransferase-like isoleucine patch superfamily enzyme